jgi:ParB family transcriptional regulator, chromosome partitioning protein
MPNASESAQGGQGARRIADIIIGIRHRRDVGDIDSLARSIAEVGLLHPIVIRPDGVLIAGERRLAACKALGWSEIPVTVVDLGEVARGELAENAERKDFLPSEIDAIRRALEPIEKAAAKERMS